jgi:hypothetical protein
VAPTIQPAQLATPGSDGSLQPGAPVVPLGDSGTGKMHLLIGSGLACGQCRKVRYATCAQLVDQLCRSRRRTCPVPCADGLQPPQSAVPDELGYVQIDPHGPELLFHIIVEREERTCIALARIVAESMDFAVRLELVCADGRRRGARPATHRCRVTTTSDARQPTAIN